MSPALFTRMSTLPNAASACSTSAVTCARVGDIGGEARGAGADRRRDLRGLRLVAPHDADPRAALGERGGDLAADAARAAGDEGVPPAEVDLHAASRWRRASMSAAVPHAAVSVPGTMRFTRLREHAPGSHLDEERARDGRGEAAHFLGPLHRRRELLAQEPHRVGGGRDRVRC